MHGTTGIWGVSGAIGVSPTVVDPCNGAGCIFDAGSLTATTLMGKSLVYLLFLGLRWWWAVEGVLGGVKGTGSGG